MDASTPPPKTAATSDLATADEIIKAITGKLSANKSELSKAKYGSIKFRKDRGKIEVELTTTH